MTQWNEAKNEAEEMLQRDLDLMMKKSHDYTPDNIHVVGEEGVASRLVDKVHRLRNLLSTSDEPEVAESIDDTLTDIRNYCTILSLKRNGKWPRSIKTLYIAGPIDDAGDYKLSNFFLVDTQKRGITCFVPQYAYVGAKNAPEFVGALNRAAISQCDAVLVVWEKPVPSFGTGRDVEYARMLNKKVFVVAPWCTSTELCDCTVFKTLDEALDHIAPQ